MAELKLFDIAGSFNQGFDRGRQMRQTNRLAQLASQAYAAPPQQRDEFVQQAIANDPASGFQLGQSLRTDEEARNQSLVNMARMLTAAPEAQRPGIYAGMVPQLQRMGLQQLPPQYDETVAQTAQMLVQAYAGGKQAEQFTLGPGSKRFDAAGNVVAEVPFAPANANIVKVPDGQGGTLDMVWDPRTRQLSDLPAAGGHTPQSAATWVEAGAKYQTPQGIVQIEPGMSPTDLEAVQADIESNGASDNYRLPTRPAAGGLGYTPPKQPAAPSGYRANPDGSLSMIPGGPAEVAAQARDEARRARESADALKRQQKQQQESQRQAAAVESAQQLIGAIDQLTGTTGFSELGTAYGDIKLGTPLIRSGVKDAQAQLKNIAGQVALTTMASLKALSSQGATGFGALSAPELKLLENSIASLSSEDISNAELARSLKVIKEKMEKITQWQPEPTFDAPAPSDGPSQPASDIDALLDMYR